MITLPHQARFSLVLAQLGRVLCAKARPLPRDPEFLPDFATPTPDQAQEMRYGLGRGRSSTNGRDR